MSVPDVLRQAALMLEQRDRGRSDPVVQYGVGGATFSLCFEAARQLYGSGAVAAMEKHLKLGQLQNATGTAVDLAKEMRECADQLGEASIDAQVAGLLAELEQVRARLAAALGGGAEHPSYDLDACVQSIEGHYRRWALKRAEEEAAARRQATEDLRTLESRPTRAPAPIPGVVDVQLPLEIVTVPARSDG